MHDFSEIKNEYIRGGKTYRQLAEEYGVSFSTLQKIAADEKWTELKKKTKEKATEKMVDAASSDIADGMKRINDAADALLLRIEYGIRNGTLVSSARDLRAVVSALKDIKEIKCIRGELDVREQEARIAKMEKEAVIETTDNEIRVILTSDLEEYAE